jgi:O-acetyl-ADP-ribose deacetylase (regulator of RNase III)
LFTDLTGQARKTFIAFATKGDWRAASRMEWIDGGMALLRETLEEDGIQSVAIPALGCGNGGLKWADVLPSIERHLDGWGGAAEVYAPGGTS